MQQSNQLPGDPGKKQTQLRTLKRLPWFILGAALLIWLFSSVDLEATATNIFQVDPKYLLAGYVAYLLGNATRALRFLRLNRLPLRDLPGMTIVVLATSLANQILPARLGELTYVYLAKKSQSLPVAKGVTSLILARMLDLLTIGLIFIAGIGPLMGQLPARSLTYFWIALGLAVSMVGLIAALVIWRRALCGAVVRFLSLPWFGWIPGRQKLISLVNEIEQALAMQAGARQYIGLILLSAVIWLSNFAMLHFVLLGLHVPVSFGKTVVGATFAALTSILPINSLGSFGTLEAGWTAGFVLLGSEAAQAVTIGFATHLLALGYALIFGLPAWGWAVWRGRDAKPQDSG